MINWLQNLLRVWVTTGWIASLIPVLSIPTSWQHPVINLAWIYNPDGPTWLWRNLTRAIIHIGEPPTYRSGFFNNAGLFIRIDLPLSIYVQLRFSRNVLLQFGGFWKERGQFGPIFRIQTDASAKAGYTISNPWEVEGWEAGPH